MKPFNVVNPGHDLIPTVAFLAMTHKLAEVDHQCAAALWQVAVGLSRPSGLHAWHDPRWRIICASYSGELAAKFTRDCRSLLQHPSYRQLFPSTVLAGKNTETEIETTHGRFRYATSVGGTLQGAAPACS